VPKKRPRTFAHAKLATLRKEKGWTQSELGERCGADKTVVWHWENGDSAPRADVLPLVADALGVTIDDLFEKAA
jgi:transcriptional regulator with XRE-family HTH domain